MDIGVYGVKPLKAYTLQPLPEQCSQGWEHYGLGNIFLAFSGFTHHCGRHDGSIQVRICPYGPCPTLYVHCFPPQDVDIYQMDSVKCYTAGSVSAWFEEHQDEVIILPWPANSSDLNKIENLRDHLDWVVHTMDSQLCNPWSRHISTPQ
ncbi:transposable element Tcb1 transposase [Trichonephila clavipes]|uniref:Transposable element Tcb1 transposase n=1 Tax=Trichonephila clavipes TaxID=2585209 RepID=A0A8X6SMZ2_TRICX|nr:transposable element Tcb1 transposase [Trichonephila clavipes]